MDLFNQFHGFFLGANVSWSLPLAVLAVLALGFIGFPLIVWTLALALLAIGFGVPTPVLIALGVVATLFNLFPLRRLLITASIMKFMKGIFPKISETEKTALEAGVVWVEGELFSGKPNFKKINQEPYPSLTAEEKAFMDGPVERLCDSLDDFKVWQERELPQAAWDIMKKERFLGMVIPKDYGGLGFSGLAHGEVIMKLASHCIPACITVMVPNSLGPAELLNHYGTQAQKKKLLPRLATGDEIPCFALTEPGAGSDAGSITSNGVVFKGDDGKLKLRLNWDKRYITLAGISTILGLAFKLKDPDNLLGKGQDLGITCALIPSNSPGVDISERHDPLGVPFYNCPTRGKDVIVDAEDSIIGGIEWAGRGWKMLMESLAAGRGISLPAQSVGGVKMITRVASSHATIRKQFGMSIGNFEGIEEALARIAGYNYLMEATRIVTCGAIDQGIKPPVITAISKYFQTELMRKALNDGMDILGGSGISRGPRNLLAHGYIASPIGITVEGANILTRTLMIFGQGAMRAHPYAYKEISAVENNDLKSFDRAFWGHVGHVVRNKTRALLLSLTRGRLFISPVSGPTAVYYRKLAWTSASFAFMADIAMGTLGGALKAKGKLTGRFADILSWMYLGFATLRRYEAEGRKKEDLPFVHFSLQTALTEIQKAFDGIYANMNVPGLGWLFKGIIRLWSQLNPIATAPSDLLTHQISQLIQTAGEQRERLTAGIYNPADPSKAMGRLNAAFQAITKSQSVNKKIRRAVKENKLPRKRPTALIKEALEKSIITTDDVALLKKAEELRLDAMTVDSYTHEQYFGRVNEASTAVNG